MNKIPFFKTVKLTTFLIAEITELIRAGSPIATAAGALGISRRILMGWYLRADTCHDPDDEIYKTLVKEISKAQEVATIRDLKIIDKCASGIAPKYAKNPDGSIKMTRAGNPQIVERGVPPDWRAAAWRLSKRNPKDWGDQGAKEYSQFSENVRENIDDSNSVNVEFVNTPKKEIKYIKATDLEIRDLAKK